MHCFHCMHELPAGGTGFCPRCGKPAQEPNAPHQLAAGTILNNRYLVGNVIGEGGFGITYIGFDRSTCPLPSRNTIPPPAPTA